VILLWGLTGDSPFDAVRHALVRRNADFVLVDQRDVESVRVDLRVGPGVTGKVEVNGEPFAFEQFSAAYWRTYDARRLPAVIGDPSEDESVLHHAWALDEAFGAWMEVTDAVVVNRPSAMASNGSKPYQSEILRRHGFDVPATLVTTDPDEVLAFWTDKSTAIYKSISGTRSIVARLAETHVSRIQQVTSCPTQFQQYVPGQDHRVHVVGDEVFATAVCSEADDYRYAGRTGEPAELVATEVPDEIAQRCIEVTRSMGLALSGIDLRRAPDGRWFCFEVNPSPGFTYYESHTGQPIADAIARLLVTPTARSTISPTC
jgi:glutathione synthase/RimK-type ligase-like ATP-grasp enzyme